MDPCLSMSTFTNKKHDLSKLWSGQPILWECVAMATVVVVYRWSVLISGGQNDSKSVPTTPHQPYHPTMELPLAPETAHGIQHAHEQRGTPSWPSSTEAVLQYVSPCLSWFVINLVASFSAAFIFSKSNIWRAPSPSHWVHVHPQWCKSKD